MYVLLCSQPMVVILNKEDEGLRIRPSVVKEELGLSNRGDAQVPAFGHRSVLSREH